MAVAMEEVVEAEATAVDSVVATEADSVAVTEVDLVAATDFTAPEATILVRCLLEAGKRSLATEWLHGVATAGVAAIGTTAIGIVIIIMM
jgi:hypothetical protein